MRDKGAAASAATPAPVVTLLGPQRFHRAVADVMRTRALSGRVAIITAGWQEREHDDQELRDHLSGNAVNLELHTRSERIFERDREFATAHRAKQSALKAIQELYDFRLGHAMEAARQLLRRRGDLKYLAPERLAAIEAVRELDAAHLTRIRAVHAEFESEWKPGSRPAVAAERSEIARLLTDCAVVAVAGGHVAVLLNRLRLFDFGTLAGSRPVIAWSAGAMALCERVVLFYDDPPHGPGNAELLDAGIGLCRGLVALPHAAVRLKLDDGARVALFARRFAPAACVTLDPGTRVDWSDGGATKVVDADSPSPRHAFRLSDDGDVPVLTA